MRSCLRKCGAEVARWIPLRRFRGGGQSARSSLNVIGWRHAVEYGSLKLASLFSVILRNDLVLEIISVSEKRMKNCVVKIIGNAFEKNDEVGLFPLKERR